MPRLLLILAVVAACGCNGSPVPSGKSSTAQGRAATVSAQVLTEEQVIRWKKLRKDVPDEQLVGYLANPESPEHWKNWRFYGTLGWETAIPKFPGTGIYCGPNANFKIQELATDMAKSAHIDATVILNLCGKESPQVVSWHWSDGEQGKKSAKAPNDKLDKSLKEFLFRVQQSAGEPKRTN